MELKIDLTSYECRGDTFARCIANDQRQAVIRKRHELIAIAAVGSNLAAECARRVAGPHQSLHKLLLDIAGQHPVLANVNYHIVGRHFPTSTGMSVLGEKNRQARRDFCLKNISGM